ncbi:DUF3800 domain-containing protein [Terrabacter terrigena]|uniref:DUF3800 domain-containing protein n=1 Tax=Terrabacter terrigena TaxID=574718 RepID=A0ABW3MYL5_9MICO
MLLAYVDESGNTGDPAAGGSHTYTLGCVLVDAETWTPAFDELVQLRRRLKAHFGLKVRDEVKANFLLRGSGALRGLGLGPRGHYVIYRAHLQTLARMPGTRAFAIVVDKRHGKWQSATQTFDLGWEGLLQRLTLTSRYEQASFMVMHDQGEDEAVRKWVRRSRRYLTAGSAFGTGRLTFKADRLVDDPSPRLSHQSYFIQMADLVAYAAFRAHIPPSASLATTCPPTMWDEIGTATHAAVNSRVARAKPGIVIR